MQQERRQQAAGKTEATMQEKQQRNLLHEEEKDKKEETKAEESKDDDSTTNQPQQQQQPPPYFVYPQDLDDVLQQMGKEYEYPLALIHALSHLHQNYLVLVTAYEMQWDANRRQVEDVVTNYGPRLRQLQQQVRQAWKTSEEQYLLDMQDDDDDEDDDDDDDDEPEEFILHDWFEDMWFGYGRSPATLAQYLNDHVLIYEHDDPRLTEARLFQVSRDFMEFRSYTLMDDDADEDMEEYVKAYRAFLHSFVTQLGRLLSDFNRDLTEHYLQYVKEHPHEWPNLQSYLEQRFQPIEPVDMLDPANFDFLTDFDRFEREYTVQRKPIVMRNVAMAKSYNYTLDFLLEKCDFMNVTDSVTVSRPVEQNEHLPTLGEWGGLEDYKLPLAFMTFDRVSGKSHPEGATSDRSLTLREFVELASRLDNLYLHDLNLLHRCSNLLWSETPYGPPDQQFMQVPSLIGRYNLFSRLPQSSYMDSWPSLFVGRKGSNSKLHVDSGAIGFLMHLFSGTKRWVIYDEAERPFLYERHFYPSFIPDLLALNTTHQTAAKRQEVHEYLDTTYPLLRRAHAGRGAYEFLQRPGDLVYIPPNTPHAVENMEDSIGVSFSLVPRAGISHHLHDLMVDDGDFAAVEKVLRYLLSNPDSLEPSRLSVDDPLYTSMGEYMAQ